MNPTHGGRAVSRIGPELLELRKPLVGSSLLTPGRHDLWVKAPCVFTEGNELVLRRLQVDKMLDAYDVEVLTQKELINCWKLGKWSPSYAFVKAAPMKVLMAVGRAFFRQLQVDGIPIGAAPVNDSAGSRKRPANEDTGKTTKDSDLWVGSDTCISCETSKSKRVKCHPSEPLVSIKPSSCSQQVDDPVELDHGPTVKAAKNDDAAVKEHQWDVWSVDHYVSEEAQTAKICIAGSYTLASHGRFFSALRSLALR